MSLLGERTAEPSKYPAPSAADADALAILGAEARNVGVEDGLAAAGDAVTHEKLKHLGTELAIGVGDVDVHCPERRLPGVNVQVGAIQ